jgi:hypothetical protein
VGFLTPWCVAAFSTIIVVACGGATKQEQNVSDASTGGRATTEAGPGPDAASTGGAGGAAASIGAEFTADASPPGDAGPAPPEYCVAPCVWELLRACTPPSGDCFVDATSEYDATYCAPRTGWIESQIATARGSRYLTIHRGTARCLDVSYGGVGGLGPSLAAYSRAGQPIATALLDERLVACGPGGILGATPLDGGVAWKVGPNTMPYVMHTDQPECAPWSALRPSALPRTPTAPSWCLSVTPGKCPAPSVL